LVNLVDARVVTYRIVGCDSSIDEVEGTGVAVLVLGLEIVPWEVRRRSGRADADVRQKSVLRDVGHGLGRN
jgi:hypothetical protein